MIKDSFSKTNKDLDLATKISYHVSFNIARAKKPHNIGEELIKHCCIEMVSILQGDEAAKKIQLISLSADTVEKNRRPSYGL